MPSYPRHLQTGAVGEALAKFYLEELGWKIIGQNVRVGRKEIDLIGLDHGVTVFVEVKTRRGNAFGTPEEAITPRKIERLQAAIALYSRTHHLKSVRFDVIAITYEASGGKPQLRHLRAVGGGSPLAFLP